MSNFDEQDDIPSLNRKDTENNLPLGWVIFFVALICVSLFIKSRHVLNISSIMLILQCLLTGHKMELMRYNIQLVVKLNHN